MIQRQYHTPSIIKGTPCLRGKEHIDQTFFSLGVKVDQCGHLLLQHSLVESSHCLFLRALRQLKRRTHHAHAKTGWRMARKCVCSPVLGNRNHPLMRTRNTGERDATIPVRIAFVCLSSTTLRGVDGNAHQQIKERRNASPGRNQELRHHAAMRHACLNSQLRVMICTPSI